MLFVYLKLGFEVSDAEFDKIYPESIQELSKRHWTPVAVAARAAKLLVKDSTTKVLDIGSGAGKFCLVGASITEAKFTGIEQRTQFVEISKGIIKDYNINNIRIVNANIKSINFFDYDSFYLFNPFYENLEHSPKIDSSINFSPDLYNEYTECVKERLGQMPPGTRIVTYHGSTKEIPLDYELISSDFHGYLKCWVKKNNSFTEENFFRESLIKHGVHRLKKFGFVNVNEQNIMIEEVYKLYFEKILKSKLGQMEFTNNAINDLLKKLK